MLTCRVQATMLKKAKRSARRGTELSSSQRGVIGSAAIGMPGPSGPRGPSQSSPSEVAATIAELTMGAGSGASGNPHDHASPDDAYL
jgi:hypothetical protein